MLVDRNPGANKLMNWKIRKHRRYLYCSRRRDGKVISEYVGAGQAAAVAFEEDQQRQAAEREREAARLAEYERGRHALDLVDACRAKVQQLAHVELRAAGYHLHARSTWRRRRIMSTGSEVPPTQLTDEDVLRRALEGDETVRPLLGDVLSRYENLRCEAGNLSLLAERTWVSLAAHSNLVVELSLREQLVRLKAELAGPAPTPLERLLVDQVGLAWLVANYAALRDAVQAGQEDDVKQREEAQRRHDRAQRRYLSSVKTLATVRKLLRPVPSPVELLMRDVAETAVPDGMKNRRPPVPIGVLEANAASARTERL